MHPLPQRILRQLLAHYGETLLDDPERVDALLADLCGGHPRERFVLVHALRGGIPQELLGQPRASTAHWRRLSQRLQRRYGFSGEAADWAVESWALALEIAPLRARLPRPLALLVGIAQKNLPLPFVLRGAPHPPAGTKRKNRVQYRENPARFPIGWVGIVATVLLAAIAAGAALAEPVRDLRVNGFFQRQNSAPTDDWQSPSLEQAQGLLLEALAPPQQARIDAELLNVREGPSVEAAVTGRIGPLGATVTVDGFSDDGRWSYIASPVEGWISNDFASFGLSAGDSVVWLRVRPELLRVRVAGAKVLAWPGVSAPTQATLVADQIVISLGSSADGQHLWIAQPVAGWIDAGVVRRE